MQRYGKKLGYVLCCSTFLGSVAFPALYACNPSKEEDLLALRELNQRFVEALNVQAEEEIPSFQESAILQGEFLFPYKISQKQARKILGLTSHGLEKPLHKRSRIHQSFKIELLSEHAPLPLSKVITHSTFHRLLTGHDGVIPTTLLTLHNVHILTHFFLEKSILQQGKDNIAASSSPSGRLGLQQVRFQSQPYGYVLMLQPRYIQTFAQLQKQALWFSPQSFHLSHLGGLLLSSFVSNPLEALAESMAVKEVQGKTLIYYAPSSLSGYPISYNLQASSHNLEVRNTLYLNSALMDLSVDERMRQRLLATDPSLFVLDWLKSLKVAEARYLKVLQESAIDTLHGLDLELPLCLPPHFASQMIQNIGLLKKALTTPTTYQAVFEALSHQTAQFYAVLKKKFKENPEEGLYALRSQVHPKTQMIFPAQTMEELLASFNPEERQDFETLNLEKRPATAEFRIQSLRQAMQEIVNKLPVDKMPLEQRSKLFVYLSHFYKEQVLEASQRHKLGWQDKSPLTSLLYTLEDPQAIALLFQLGADPRVRNEDTPLVHKLKKLIPEHQKAFITTLEALVEGGVDLMALGSSPEGESVFDIALERELDQVFIKLIQLSKQKYKDRSFLYVKAPTAMKAYQLWKDQFSQNQALEDAFKTLKHACPEVAWHITLEELLPPLKPLTFTYEQLQEIAERDIKPKSEDDYEDILSLIRKKRPLVKIQKEIEEALGRPLAFQGPARKIQGATIGERTLPAEIEKQIFDLEGKVRRANQYGRRDVARAERNTHVLYFKHLPELPGYEYAMQVLHHSLIGYGTPYSDLIRIGDEAFLVSLGIEGENLVSVLKNTPDQLQSLDLKSFSEMVLMTMLINPEDGKADNYILESLPFKEGSYRLIGVDNDHALMPTIARQTDQHHKKFLQVKSILYCMDQMQKPIPPQVKEAFHHLDPYSILKTWLLSLEDLDKKYDTLFRNEEARRFMQHDCVVCVPFKPSMMTQLYDKLLRLQKICSLQGLTSSSRELTPQHVLEQLEPLLAQRYRVGFEEPRSVAKRFEVVNGRFYNRNQYEAYVSTTSSKLLLSSLNIPIQESLIDAVRRGGHLRVENALEELKVIQVQKDFESLGGQTAVDFLKSLKLEHNRAKFLSQFDFAKLDLGQQQAFLRCLAESNPSRLTFKNCAALSSDSLLKEIGCGNLEKLKIENCEHIEGGLIPALAEESPGLKSFFLEGITKAVSFMHTRPFEALTSLVIKNCKNLTKLQVNAPHLKRLEASQCPKLDSIEVTYPTLRTLELTEDASLTDTVLDALLHAQTALKKLDVRGSKQVSFPEIRTADWKFPLENLLKTSWEANDEFIINSLTRLLVNDKTLTALNLSQKYMGAAGAQLLAEALRHNTTLTTLDLERNQMDDEDAQSLAEALRHNTTLTTLDLRGNQMGPAGVQSLAEALQHNTTLTALNLEENWINDVGTQSLAEALRHNTTLTTLDLRHNEIGAAGAQSLAEALRHNTTLTTLDLRYNEIDAAGAQSLAEALRHNTTLTKLDLGYNKIDAAGAQSLAEALRHNTTLTALDLGENEIGAAGAQSLAEALRHNTTLTALDLRENKIGDARVQSLAEALHHNTTLTALDLRENKIGDAGAQSLAEALHYNTTLTNLNLWYNEISDAGAQSLAEALRYNTTLTRLRLRRNQMGKQALEEIDSYLTRNKNLTQRKILRTFLLQKPKALPLQGVYQKGTWVFASSQSSSEPQSLLDALKFDSMLFIQQLLSYQEDGAFREAFAPFIKKAFMDNLLPVEMHNQTYRMLQEARALIPLSSHKEEELMVYAKDKATYRDYVRFVLSGQPLQHKEHYEVLKHLLPLNSLPCCIWQKGTHTSLSLIADLTGQKMPVHHLLYHPPLEGKTMGSYKPLTVKETKGTFPFSSPELEEELELELFMPSTLPVPSSNGPAFAMSQLQSLSPALQSRLQRLKVSDQKLQFTPRSLSKEDALDLADLMRDNTSLTQLNLPECGLTDEGVTAWKEVIAHNRHLTSLILSSNHITRRGIDKFIEAFQSNTTLLQLGLTGNSGFDEDAGPRQCIEDLLSRNRGLYYRNYVEREKPREVNVSQIGEVGTCLLLETLGQANFIESLALNFTSVHKDTTVKALETYLHQATHLQSLTLLDTSMNDRDLARVIEALYHHPDLETLDLRGNFFKDRSVDGLIELINRSPSLKHLDVRWSMMEETHLKKLLKAWQDNTGLVNLVVDQAGEDLQAIIRELRDQRTGMMAARGTPLIGPALIKPSSSKGSRFEITLQGQTFPMQERPVRGDGNCGYHALQTTREEVAQKLLENLEDPTIRLLMGTEVGDQFDQLPRPLTTDPAYKDLQARRKKIDITTAEQVQKLNNLLKRPEGSRWSQEQLLEHYFTYERTPEMGRVMKLLIELALQEQKLNQEKKAYCHHPETLKRYINLYIKVPAGEYCDKYGELNWLGYSPQQPGELHRFSSVDAIARVLGKNLVIWQIDPQALTYFYHWNPQAGTLHLLHRDGNHFNQLTLIQEEQG
jgi:Ran GTPase-activating protein (RanGAP) involved in mRNA processing and transport